MSAKINVGGVETFSTVDFPEHMAAVVFLQGCPWRCPFCHNTSLQPIDAETDFVWEKFLGFLEKRRGILDAVVFSGGEPLVQNSLEEALDDVIALGYKTALHTGGYRPEALRRVLPKLDWVGFDVKAPLTADAYRKATGGYDKIDNVRQSLNALLESGVDFECRTTCDPRILNIEDIYAIADSLKKAGVKTYRLQRYRQVEGDATPDSECEKFLPIRRWKNICTKVFPTLPFVHDLCLRRF